MPKLFLKKSASREKISAEWVPSPEFVLLLSEHVFSLPGVTDLPFKVEAAIVEHGLLSAGEPVLAAVSGGLDSMVLLHVLAKLAGKFNWKLSVAHFNHELRGPSSDADEAFVARAAKKLGLQFFSERGHVREFARDHSISVEMAARQLRHEFLARCAKREHIARIALAHHADDQVELFLLRLLRGAGPEGLKGMQKKSPSPIPSSDITLVRPLLDITKPELEAFAKQNKIRFREDATNAALDFLRNRVRHELLPLLAKKYQPAIRKTTLRLMNLLEAESSFVASAAESWFESPSDFGKLPIAVQRRVVQAQLIGAGLPASFEAIEWLRMNAQEPMALNSNLRVLRENSGKLRTLEKGKPGFNSAEQLTLHLESVVSPVSFGSIQVNWKIANRAPGLAKSFKPRAGQENFDADRVGSVVVLRHWRPGDRFQPIGMEGSVKLQDWFSNLKIPKDKRHALVVAATKTNQIFWVEDQRIAEKFKITAQTKRRLVWEWTRAC